MKPLISKVALYFIIFAFVFLNSGNIDLETTIFYLGVSGVIWAVIWFMYMFVRDTIIAARWKKPNFPLPQYIQEDAKLEKMREEMSQEQLNDPYDPSFHPFRK
ncbi:hypothetical protein [Nitrosomonas eutropha]|uniref:hypothetical protein n=1 Tax=Nitrosomonas eutropha TaxID=916 RepID=UPI0008D2279B|nr:hypothetical protein [Nitrosomonas eutropha]SEJ01424.1 hypothetical protein SAMN05216318_12028 [Nitrosomonas eutropha]